MSMEVFKEFKFEAAHCLAHLPDGHKCRALHGHSYRVRVFVAGKIGQESGWIVDFADIKAAMAPILSQLDHSFLNDIEGLEMPTAEHLAIWIWNHLAQSLTGLARIEIWETDTSGVIYHGPSS